MGTEFQILAPWIDFWHREKENFGIYGFFLVEDRVRQLWIEEIGETKWRYWKEELIWNVGTSFFQLQMCTDQQFLKYLVYKSEELSGFGNYSKIYVNGLILEM